MMATKPAAPRSRPKIERIIAMKSSMTVVWDNKCAETMNTMITYRLESFIAFQMKPHRPANENSHAPRAAVRITSTMNAASMLSYIGRFRSAKPIIATVNTATRYTNSNGTFPSFYSKYHGVVIIIYTVVIAIILLSFFQRAGILIVHRIYML